SGEHGYRAGVVGVAGVGQRVARPVRRGGAGPVRGGPRRPGSEEGDPAGEDRRDRGADTELPSGGRNPLELPNYGRGYRGVEIDCSAGVVGAGPQTAPG